jgi:ABC-type antimicrobial peptide transport system permease subunit
MLIVQISDPEQSDVALTRIRDLLRSRHRLPHDALDNFTLTSPRAIMAQVTALGSKLRTLLLVLSILATAIGGVVILSLTLIGVSERRREIGVRRAVGAARPAILMQFLLEALCLAVSGGFLGILLGIGGTQIVSRWQHLPFLIDGRTVVVAALISLGLGILAGIYGAWKASRVDPVEALRT